jgi:hypothetical protein
MGPAVARRVRRSAKDEPLVPVLDTVNEDADGRHGASTELLQWRLHGENAERSRSAL